MAQIVIDKYIDHLPLYRQMQRFERAGVKLSYSTLTDWVSDTCKLITPLFEALKAEVLKSNYLHADETPIKVMDKDKKGETHRGYYWVYQNSIDKIVFLITRKAVAVKGQQKYYKTLKVICKQTAMLPMMFLMKKKTLRKSIAWRMPGGCLMMPWTMTGQLQNMLWKRSKSYILLNESAGSKIYRLEKQKLCGS